MNQKIKISQLPAKGSNLAAADLLEIAEFTGTGYISKSITGQEIIDAIPAPSVDWGDIGGTLSNQTDLQSALDAKVPTTRTLTINGTTQDLSADRTFTISTGITIGSTAITSGVVGRVLFQGAGNVVQQSSSLFWDNTNSRFGIGTSAPAYVLDVNADNAYFGLNRNPSGSGPALFFFRLAGAGGANVGIAGSANDQLPSSVANDLFLRTNGFSILFGNSSTTWGKFFTTGNLGINTTTDAGFRLDVNGTARVTSLFVNLSTGSIPFMGGSGLLTQNNSSLFWDNTNQRLGIGTGTPLDKVHISTNGNNAVRLTCNASNGNSISLRDIDGTYQGGLLGTGTNFVYGTYRALQASINGGIGGVGLRTGNGANAHISFYSGNADSDLSTERIRLVASTGNFLINTTTDAGFRLDVNGTARVSGNVELPNFSLILQSGISGFAGSGNILLGNNFNIRAMNASNTGTMNLIKANSSNNIEIGGSNHGNTFINPTLNSGQTVVVGDNVVVASAVLNVSSTTKGFLPPRMTTTQKNAIASPAAGLMVYDTTLNVISYYNGSMWI